MHCDHCDLLFINPYPDTSSAQHTSVTEYAYDDLTVALAATHHLSAVPYYRQYFNKIAAQCQGASSLLDVGCGTGNLLQLVQRDLGMYCEGIELNKERAQYARQITGCIIHQEPIERFTSSRQWDVITLINVLSHIPSFTELFDSLRDLLSDNGKVILKVGEVSSSVQKNAIFDWGIPDHLHMLGLNTIGHVCETFGFRVLQHDRNEMSDELFSAYRWKSPGRSRSRDWAKKAIAHTPGALYALRRLYQRRFGGTIYSSFIVLGKV
jgi:SAM-dependent methyltransferase